MNIAGKCLPAATTIPAGFDIARAGLGLMLGPYARVCQDPRFLLVLEGETLDLSLVLALAEPARLQTAYGLFGYVWHDSHTQKTIIGTDQLGFFPFYFAHHEAALCFSSSLTYLKSQLTVRTPDYAAWEELLILGDVIADKTTVREIRRLDPGTTITISQGRLTYPCFWKPAVPDMVDEATYVRDNNALLDEALVRTSHQTRQKIVPLSGGEDSRRIADSAIRNGLDVSFVTQEAAHHGEVDIDTKLARKVASVLGQSTRVVPVASAEQALEDWLARDIALGFESLTHEWLLPLVRNLPANALVYDGIIGDVTINAHYFKAFPLALSQYREPQALASMICGKPRDWLSEISRRAEVPLVERVRSILATYPDSPHRLTFFFLLNHTRRKIALLSQLFGLDGHWNCYPYAYAPLLLQSLSADPSRIAGRFMQRECLAAVSPTMLSVPTTRGEIPQSYLTDVRQMSRSEALYRRRALAVTTDALDVFPLLRARARWVRLLQQPGLGGALHRFGWFIEPLARFGRFLEWLRSDDVGPIRIRQMPAGAAGEPHVPRHRPQ